LVNAFPWLRFFQEVESVVTARARMPENVYRKERANVGGRIRRRIARDCPGNLRELCGPAPLAEQEAARTAQSLTPQRAWPPM
jgi:hypothetical protein